MTPEQREELQSCYGRHDDKSVERVKALYDALGDACSLSTARRGKLPAPAQADRVSRPKPSSRRLLELCKEDLQEEQVDVAEGLGLKA
uniref:Uncharacterized protein n=1 Tax=Anguilla anguilla TaxID=7936 RepID=A0A0E9UQK9_ANGAN